MKLMYGQRKGLEGELKLLSYLESKYPDIEFTLGNGKAVYDIFCDYALFDNVSTDNQYRLITDHKWGMFKHKRVSRILGKPGYIAFSWDGDYYFLPVTSTLFIKYVRPTIDGYLLRSCKPLKL